MKDVTSTTFGLLIAFFLPGFVALLALAYWIPPFQEILSTFLTAQSNVGLFLLVALAAIAVSLLLSLVRWALFEELALRCQRFPKGLFSKMVGDEPRLQAFQAAVDAHYRFHQFFGEMALALPILYMGWFRSLGVFPVTARSLPLHVLFVALEALTVWGAVDSYSKYIRRGTEILKGAAQ